ncbi:MAG: glycosyltransferase family 4 protein [Candidatus Adlerbacteria bacterium]|nr:glycosyltransferase family 4 protein [Candidatus Adlerbacteria bacterium]
MSTSIITVANLGKKTNLKTADILPVIDEFTKKGELKQVICQINTKFGFPHTYSAIPALIRYPLRVLEKLSGLSFGRVYRLLSDYFVERRLQWADVTFFHPPTRFEGAMQKAKRNGSITVGIATVAHPLLDQEIHKEEYRRFNSPFHPQNFEKLKAIVEQFDYIIAISDFVKTSYIEKGFPANRIFVAYTGIPLPPAPERDKKGSTFKVLYVAYTNPRKGLSYLLDAWQELKLPNAELILVGKYSGDVPEKLREYCDSIINSDPSITWAGDTRDPSPYYKEASIFVLPSLSEGNPRVVMEAMAHGLPVITTPNAQSVVEDGKSGFVVPIRDSGALKEKIAYLYNHRDVAEQMGREGRRVIEHKKPFGEAVFDIYREVMKRKG